LENWVSPPPPPPKPYTLNPWEHLGECIWGHFENLGTLWELDRNILGTRVNPRPFQKEKNWNVHEYLHIGCA